MEQIQIQCAKSTIYCDKERNQERLSASLKDKATALEEVSYLQEEKIQLE